MTRRSLCWSLTWGLALATGCAPPAPRPDQTGPSSITIPPPRPPRITLSTEEAAMVYPETEKLERDPFLTQEEEHPEMAPVAPTPTAEVKKAVRKKPAGPQPLVLKQLHESVSGIINGPRNTFFFQGRLYEEGDTLPDSDWVVISIKPTGIRLRSKDGATDFLPFTTDTGGSIIIKKSP